MAATKKSGPATKAKLPKPSAFTKDDIDEIVGGIRKVAGEDKAVLASGGGLDIKIRGVIGTRCAPLDDAIGRGGIPLGRLTILHGPEACLAGATLVSTNRAGKGATFTLEHLEKMQNGGVASGKSWDLSVPTFVRSMHPDGTTRLARLGRVFKTGERLAYELRTEGGKAITASADHVFMTSVGWRRLEVLKIGDAVMVECGNKPQKKVKNNALSNLEVLTPGEHRARHKGLIVSNLAVRVEEDRVISISEVGAIQTYDMTVEETENFVANGFVTHNSGKTTLALQAVAECQSMGGVCVYMDHEFKLDIDYAQALGVDMDRLILSQPGYLEQTFAVMEATIKKAGLLRERYGKRVPILVVLDSMNAAITKAQLEGEWDDMHMAPQARCYSSLLPKLIPMASKEDVALLFISQVRKKMNVTYGSDEEIAGGKAPPFYASLIIHVKRISTLKDGEVSVGNRTQAECKKNQISPPFRKALFVIAYGKGVDNERAIIELAAEKNVLDKKGGHYSFKAQPLGNGLGKCADYLRRDPEMLLAITDALKANGKLSVAGDPYGGGEDVPAPASDDDEDEEKPRAKFKGKLNIGKMRDAR
jgi:recombination protein RecA